MSGEAPAGTPTMMRTCREGYVWALPMRHIAGRTAALVAAPRNARRASFAMFSLRITEKAPGLGPLRRNLRRKGLAQRPESCRLVVLPTELTRLSKRP